MEPITVFLIILLIMFGIYLLSKKDKLKENNNSKSVVSSFLETFQPAFEQRKKIPIYTGDLSIILQDDEYPILPISADLYEERKVRNFYGGSYRIANGISVFGGQSRSKSELQKSDHGKLIITNRRLVFLGAQRNSSIQYDKLLSLDCYDNCITIHRNGKSKAEVFFTDKVEIIKYLTEIFLKYDFVLDKDNTLIEAKKYEYGMKRLRNLMEMMNNNNVDKNELYKSVMKFANDIKNGDISNYSSIEFAKRLGEKL